MNQDRWKVASTKTATDSRTLARRMDELYSGFMKDVQAEVEKIRETLGDHLERRAVVRLQWEVAARGFPRLVGTVLAADGTVKKFAFLPEEPFTAASKILYEIGGF